MLRPSRPMMRPFMSSAGSWTTDTVVSAAWPAARRCMTTARMLRTRRSASRLVSSSIWRTRRAESWRIWSSSSLSRSCLACDGGEAGDALERADVALVGLVGLQQALREQLLARVELGDAGVERAPRGRSGAPPGGRSPGAAPARRPSRPGRPALLGRRHRAPGCRRGCAGGREPGGPLDQQQRRDHQAGRKHGRRDHDFHCPCPLSVRRPAGRGEIRCFFDLGAADRVGPGARSERISMKGGRGPPRQTAARCVFEGSAAGASARSVGVFARGGASWPSRLKLLEIALKVDDLLLVSKGPDGPGLSLRGS